MELHPYETDRGFAGRSARYLADRGCTPRQISRALVEQLELSLTEADEVIASLSATPAPAVVRAR